MTVKITVICSHTPKILGFLVFACLIMLFFKILASKKGNLVWWLNLYFSGWYRVRHLQNPIFAFVFVK